MNDERKPPERPPPPVAPTVDLAVFEGPKRDTIPVAMLKFDDKYPIELPGNGVSKSAITGMPRGRVLDEKGKRAYQGPCWVIDFIPAIRHHRVVYFAADAKAPQVRMVWEGHVRAWEPLSP